MKQHKLPHAIRVNFRPYQDGDAQFLVSLLNNKKVNEFFEHEPPFSMKQFEQVIQYATKAEDYYGFIILDKTTENPIGMFEVHRISQTHKSCFFEFALLPDAGGKGLGTEIFQSMVNFVFDDLNLSRITMKAFTSNTKIISVARKCGFKVEGILHASVFSENKWQDEIILSLMKVNRLPDIHMNLTHSNPVALNPLELIGNTPIVDITDYFEVNSKTKVYVKLEMFNPAGSIKDRAALAMIKSGIKDNKISNNTVIIEPTSGNTGIGLAYVAANLNLKIIVLAPEGAMALGKMQMLQALGATIIITPGLGDYDNCVKISKELSSQIKNSFMANQFENQNNTLSHEQSTFLEISQQLGKIHYLVAGLGSSGTLMGNGKLLKKNSPNFKCIAVEPYKCSIIKGEPNGDHEILGIGPGFSPKIMNTGLIDDVITPKDKEASQEVIKFARKKGLFVGISSGAVLAAIRKLVKRKDTKGIVLGILADGGLRYGKECFHIRELNELHQKDKGLFKYESMEDTLLKLKQI